MAAITFLREKKWIISGFALLGVALLFFSVVPNMYHTSSQEKDVVVEGKLYNKEQYKRLLKRYGYDEEKLRQQLRKETLTKQILAEAGITVTNNDVKGTMFDTSNKHVRKILDEYYKKASYGQTIDSHDTNTYKKCLDDIKKDPQQLNQYKLDLKNVLRKEKALQLLPLSKKTVLLDKEAPQKTITYRRIPLDQIVTDGPNPTVKDQKDFLAENQHLFSTKMSANVLCQTFHISPSYQELKKAKEDIHRYQKAFKEAENPQNYAERHSDEENVEQEWDADKIPHFLQGKPKGYVSSPKKVGNQYKMYRIKETKNSEGKFVVYQIARDIPCKGNANHIKKRIEGLQKEHRTQDFNQIHKKYGYYHNYKGDQITIDIHPDMVNYPPNNKYGAIARKIYNDHYKKGQYFSIEIKDPKTNALQKILLCTLLRRGKGNSLDYNQKKICDGLKAEQKLKKLSTTLEALDISKKSIKNTKNRLTQKYGSAQWSDFEKISFENMVLYGDTYPKEITEILMDDKTKPFYAFLNKDKTHIIVVLVNKTVEATPQKVTQTAQKPKDRFEQYNTTHI